MIILEYLDMSRIDARLFEHVSDDTDTAKPKNYHAAVVHRQKLAGRALLRSALVRHFDLTDPVFAVEHTGRPYLQNAPNLDFNLSHSGNIVLCAILRKGKNPSNRVGVDVELIQSDRTAERIPALCARYFSAAEERQVISEDDVDIPAFYRIWTGKESIVKYTGAGIGDISPKLDSTDEKYAGRLFHYTLTDSGNQRYAASVLLPRGFAAEAPEVAEGIFMQEGEIFFEK